MMVCTNNEKNDSSRTTRLYGWLVALTPIILTVVTEFVIDSESTNTNTLITIVIVGTLVAIDIKHRTDSQLRSPSHFLFLIPPVYLFVRDRIDKRKPFLMCSFFVFLILSSYISYYKDVNNYSTSLAMSSCPVVSQILAEKDILKQGLKCIKVTNVNQIEDTNLYSADAIVSTGKFLPITIKVNKENNNIEVVIPNIFDAY
ncbi:hypothetical protein F7287_12215 [Salmonella enterica]|nr:hypothetical protein [Salmonella enterica]ECZ2622532.1 hypothetical protein [Salmonella enterica]